MTDVKKYLKTAFGERNRGIKRQNLNRWKDFGIIDLGEFEINYVRVIDIKKYLKTAFGERNKGIRRQNLNKWKDFGKKY